MEQTMIKGYARVSTTGQTLEVQLQALKAGGAAYVFSEKQSGVKSDRKELARCMASLQPGDVLLATKLDRLARSSRDLLNTLHAVEHAGASFKSLDDPWADTTTPAGKLIITVMAGMAEFERHLILSRTNEGRQLARANGVKFGRKPKLTPTQQRQALERVRTGKETLREIAATFNVGQMVIHRLASKNSVSGDEGRQ
jgi:DNA invertase Pin-like site-specific DNA recombinase